jgi:hypothetical protein
MGFHKAILSALVMLMTVTAAAQQNAEQAKKNLSGIFRVAVTPIRVHTTLSGEDTAYIKKSFGEKIAGEGNGGAGGGRWFNDNALDEDTAYCFEQTRKAYWAGYVPFYGAQFRVRGNWYSEYMKIDSAKHAHEARCEKFQLSFYRRFPNFLKSLPKTVPGTSQPIQQGNLYKALPYEFMVSVVLPTFATKAVQGFQTNIRAVQVEMAKIAQRSDVSEMEVCAAVAVGDVAAEALRKIDNPISNGNFTTSSGTIPDDAQDDVNLYQSRIRFLAFTVSDWIAKTNGNTKLCPNFGLELEVRELAERVYAAERRLNSLSGQVDGLRTQLATLQRQQRSDEIFGTVAFWSLGFAGYRMLTPR